MFKIIIENPAYLYNFTIKQGTAKIIGSFICFDKNNPEKFVDKEFASEEQFTKRLESVLSPIKGSSRYLKPTMARIDLETAETVMKELRDNNGKLCYKTNIMLEDKEKSSIQYLKLLQNPPETKLTISYPTESQALFEKHFYLTNENLWINYEGLHTEDEELNISLNEFHFESFILKGIIRDIYECMKNYGIPISKQFLKCYKDC
jgi:hypothetical protein